MLQELDRRHAVATPDGQLPPRHVRAVSKLKGGHEWFWRFVAGLLIVAVAWVLWITYQLQARPLVTDQAFKAAARAEQRALLTPEPVPAAPQVPPLFQVQGLVAPGPKAPATPSPQPPESTPAATPTATPAATVAAPEPAMKASSAHTTKPAAVVPETLRLAHSIETPIPNRSLTMSAPAGASPKPQPAEPAPPRAPAQPSPPPSVQSGPKLSPAQVQSAPAAATAARVEKHERIRTPAERAEADVRRGVALLKQGRASEADDAFDAALSNFPSHRAARQARIALLLEQRRLDEARKLLQEGVAIDPSHTPYSLVLARVFIERGDFPASLEVLNAAQRSAQGDADFSALHGNVLQRLARHREAADAYRDALRLAPDTGTAWVGLAMSLEALEHRPEAVEAFHRAVATRSLSAELRVFAEQRARLLQR